MTSEPAGRTVLVTGGASGIGRATVEVFAGNGDRVVVADIDLARAEETASSVGQGAFAVRLNVGELATIDGVVRAIADRTGGIDVLVNNAGIYDMEPLLATTPVSVERLFRINVHGTFFVLQAVARRMVDAGRGGCIINMASQAGRRGEAPSAIYAATKAAVISLTQSAALALIEHRIRVNALAPGVIDTPMWEHVDRLHAEQLGLEIGARKREVGEAVPYGRMGRPEEVAGAALFLASPAAEYIVGQTLNVDGGNVLS